MADQFDDKVTEAVDSIRSITESLLADDGELTGALQAHASSLEDLLGTTFDPDSKRSVLALFENVIATTHAEQRKAVSQLFDTESEDGPLSALKRDFTRELKEQIREVKNDLQGLSERIAVNEAIAPIIDITTSKGFTFEDVLAAQLDELASQHGDLAEQTGAVLGDAATKKGDAVVTLSRDDTPGGEGRVVFEAKTTRLNRRDTMKELEAAASNRGAHVAIAVFSRQDLAPTTVPFSYSDDRAIVVLDPDAVDPGALRLAYMWARWMARRAVADARTPDALDTDRVARLIDEANRSVERASSIRGCHTKARKALDQAGTHLDDMAEDVRAALDELALAIRLPAA